MASGLAHGVISIGFAPTVDTLANYGVTLASALFQTLTVQYFYLATDISDETGLLQSMRDQ